MVATCARGLERLEAAFRDSPPDARARLFLARCDVRDEEDVAGFVEAAAERLGGLDALVNNAGTGVAGTFVETPVQVWREQLDVKVLSVVHTVRAALEYLYRSDAPRVVNISGVTAHVPHPGMVAVSSARAALGNLSRSLATELATAGVLVNTVNLGVFDTGRLRARYEQSDTTSTWEQWCRDEARHRSIPLGRVGLPEEVAPIVCFLASPRNTYVTGAEVDVAGGAGGYV